ncbi:MAG: hypothetical protein IKV03_04495 [Alphaproteobacteria bacterium]|nr:hypothetical protein [Alphaproteobacteria bacterium]
MIQQIIGMLLLFAFFSFLFLVAGYVVLPLLLIFIVATVIARLWYKIKLWLSKKQSVEILEKSTSRRVHKKEIIDVDYTEV